jgi:hypothetical protein
MTEDTILEESGRKDGVKLADQRQFITLMGQIGLARPPRNSSSVLGLVAVGVAC